MRSKALGPFLLFMANQFIYSLNFIMYVCVRTTRDIFKCSIHIHVQVLDTLLCSLAVEGDYVDFRWLQLCAVNTSF